MNGMERQKSPSRESIDLLSYLHRHPDGWRVVGEANAALSSAGTEAQKAEAEMRSFGEVGELLGDDNLYNQKPILLDLPGQS